jgi:hypothetical protein
MDQTERLSWQRTGPRPVSGETLVRRPRICLDRVRRSTGSPNNFKRLVNFLNLRKNWHLKWGNLAQIVSAVAALCAVIGAV